VIGLLVGRICSIRRYIDELYLWGGRERSRAWGECNVYE
jgi:hypothetical protein